MKNFIQRAGAAHRSLVILFLFLYPLAAFAHKRGGEAIGFASGFERPSPDSTTYSLARRKFFQAVELNPKDQYALRIVAQMDELFAIDAQARKQGLSPQDRQLLRLEQSKPLLKQINSQIQRAAQMHCQRAFWPRLVIIH